MFKPKIQNSALASTAQTVDPYHGTASLKKNTVSRQLETQSKNLNVSSFQIPQQIVSQPRRPQQSVPVQNQTKTSEFQEWKNTETIDNIIKSRIETESDLSTQPLSGLRMQSNMLGPQRICTEKIFQPPKQVIQALQMANQGPRDQNSNIVSGYLKNMHAVYYIVGLKLFIYRYDTLKNMAKSQNILSDFEPLSLKPNCRGIHELDMRGLNPSGMPSETNGQLIVLEYPYRLQVCAYGVQVQEKRGSLQGRSEEDRYRRYELQRPKIQENGLAKIELFTLNFTVALETSVAEFITTTRLGSIIYLSSAGTLKSMRIFRVGEIEPKRKTFEENSSKRKHLISRNQNFLKSAKQYFRSTFEDFTRSLNLSYRKNLNLIYDSQRSMVYTLTCRGDRSQIVQSMKNEIRVYEIKQDEDDVRIYSLWIIDEDELIEEIKAKQVRVRSRIFAISKVDKDYCQDCHLVVIFQNGYRAYLYVGEEEINVLDVIQPVDVKSLPKGLQKQNRMMSSFFTSTQRDPMARGTFVDNEITIPKKTYEDSRLKAYYHTRNLSINMIKTQSKIHTYLTQGRHFRQSTVDVFPIKWYGQDQLMIPERLPAENFIFESKYMSHYLTSTMYVEQLERAGFESVQSWKAAKSLTLNGHEFLRQVHYGPREFVYFSLAQMGSFVLLRPIDILYYMLKRKQPKFCEDHLCQMLNASVDQVCCMLLQVYCDTNPQTKYWMSKRYQNRLDESIQIMKSYGRRVNPQLRQAGSLSPLNTDYLRVAHDKILKNEDPDELIDITQGINEEFRVMIKLLFVELCNKKRHKSNFQQIVLSEDKNNELEQPQNISKKIQAGICLMYISRVFYPWWSIKIDATRNRVMVQMIKERVLSLFPLVDMLKVESNPFYKQLAAFLSKVRQILGMMEQIRRLPDDLTMEQAINLNAEFFQEHMFMNLIERSDEDLILHYKREFPMFVTKEFILLINIFKEITLQQDEEQVKLALARMKEYPEYFLRWLKREKKIDDWERFDIRKKGEQSYEPVKIEVPNLTFRQFIPHVINQVCNPQIGIKQKFAYLQAAKTRINAISNPKTQLEQQIPLYFVSKAKADVDELFNMLKMQQECKKVLIQMTKKEIQNERRQGQGLLGRIVESWRENQKEDEEKAIKDCQLQLERLDSVPIGVGALENLVMDFENARLSIHFEYLFGRTVVNRQDVERREKALIGLYAQMVRQGKQFADIANNSQSDRQKLKKLKRFLQQQISEHYEFMNSVYKQIEFGILYEGLKQQLYGIEAITKHFHKGEMEYVYSIGSEIAKLGYGDQRITQHLNNTMAELRMNAGTDQQEPDYLKKFLFDLYCAFEVATKFDPSQFQKLQKLTSVIDSFIQEMINKAGELGHLEGQTKQKLMEMSNKIIDAKDNFKNKGRNANDNRLRKLNKS